MEAATIELLAGTSPDAQDGGVDATVGVHVKASPLAGLTKEFTLHVEETSPPCAVAAQFEVVVRFLKSEESIPLKPTCLVADVRNVANPPYTICTAFVVSYNFNCILYSFDPDE